MSDNYTAQVRFISVSQLTHWMPPFLSRISADAELILVSRLFQLTVTRSLTAAKSENVQVSAHAPLGEP